MYSVQNNTMENMENMEKKKKIYNIRSSSIIVWNTMRHPPRSELVGSFVAMVLSCSPGGSLGKTQWKVAFSLML